MFVVLRRDGLRWKMTTVHSEIGLMQCMQRVNNDRVWFRNRSFGGLLSPLHVRTELLLVFNTTTHLARLLREPFSRALSLE